MKSIQVLAALAASGMACAPAIAQDTQEESATYADESGFYVGAGISLFFVDKDAAAQGLPITFVDQPSPGAFKGILGYEFNKNFAVEVEAGVGGAESEFTTNNNNNANGDIGLKSMFGAHAVLTVPMQGYYLQGRVGYEAAKFETDLYSFGVTEYESNGVSLGAGAGIRMNDWDFRMDYSFVSGSDANSGVLGMNVLRHF